MASDRIEEGIGQYSFTAAEDRTYFGVLGCWIVALVMYVWTSAWTSQAMHIAFALLSVAGVVSVCMRRLMHNWRKDEHPAKQRFARVACEVAARKAYEQRAHTHIRKIVVG